MDNSETRIGCVLMAAGNSLRFHSDKLAANFNGKTLFARALDVIPEQEFYRVVVVAQSEKHLALARERSFRTVLNEYPDSGLSHTVALGIGALQGADAILFLVADQPLLRKQSVCNALTLYRANPSHIVAMAYGERRGNPCIFPRAYFSELFALEGDSGGRTVMEMHEDNLLLCYVQDGRELVDVDTVEALRDLIR